MRSIQEIGLELKKHRIENDIDINQLMKDMKISKTTLNLVERGEYEVSNVKNRMIYKKYIEKLGLNYGEYEEDIKRLFPNIVEETINLSQNEILENVEVKKKFTINKGAISILIIFLFLIALIPMTVYNFNNSVVTDEVVNETTVIANTKLVPDSVIEPEVPEVTVNRTSANNIEVELEDLNNVIVKIVASGDTYYDYSLNQVISEQGMLTAKKEKTIEIRNAEDATVNIGNLANAKVYINDYEITEKISEVGTQNYITFKLKSTEG